jgi:hypothetical protein
MHGSFFGYYKSDHPDLFVSPVFAQQNWAAVYRTIILNLRSTGVERMKKGIKSCVLFSDGRLSCMNPGDTIISVKSGTLPSSPFYCMCLPETSSRTSHVHILLNPKPYFDPMYF